MKTETKAVDIDRDKGDFAYPEVHVRDAGRGLSEKTIHYISDVKEDPDWVREFRLRGLKTFLEKPLPTHWASKDLEAIDFDKIRYYLGPGGAAKRSWDEVPEDIKRTFERLGIPEQERKFLAGVEAQFDSEAVYSNIKKAVGEQGVIFVGSREGLKNYPEIFRKWFGKVIPIADNKFSALNSAVFSGGSFIYVPPGVKVKHPLQAYFRINAENFGQFERTLIIADEGSEVTYMEGCTAPKFNTPTLHSAVVELVALKGAKIQYITVQNWASNVFNLVTKRGLAHENAEVKWIDCNIGSRLTMKYPGVIMKGRKARGEVLSIALANDGQHQDTGAKMIHAADETTSNIISKSISIGKGRATYRGLVHVPKHLKHCKNNTECDALLINSTSRTDTYPAITVRGTGNAVQHEASVSQASSVLSGPIQSRELPQWFRDQQAEAWRQFESLPSPNRKDQLWRFSNVDLLDLSPFKVPGVLSDDDRRNVLKYSRGLDEVAARMIFANDQLVERNVVSEQLKKRGVIFQPLERAMVEHADLFQKHFMSQPAVLGSAKFAALHKARVSSGTFLFVPRGVEIELPIEIFHWLRGEKMSIFPHLLLVTDELAKVTVIEHFASCDKKAAGFACGVNDLISGPGAKITYVCA